MGKIAYTVCGIALTIIFAGLFIASVGAIFSGCATISLHGGKFSGYYCPKCHRPIYGDALVCPKDNAPINGYKYWFWVRGRPEPRMAYPAETYLIKTGDDKFVWSPYEVDLSLE